MVDHVADIRFVDPCGANGWTGVSGGGQRGKGKAREAEKKMVSACFLGADLGT